MIQSSQIQRSSRVMLDASEIKIHLMKLMTGSELSTSIRHDMYSLNISQTNIQILSFHPLYMDRMLKVHNQDLTVQDSHTKTGFNSTKKHITSQ